MKLLKLHRNQTRDNWTVALDNQECLAGWWNNSVVYDSEVHEFVFRANNRKFRVELVSAGTKS